jgi:hypothetical protein
MIDSQPFYAKKDSIQLLQYNIYNYIIVIKYERYSEKRENKIFLIYKEIQMGAVAKSYMSKGFLIYEEMRKYLVIDEAVSHTCI